jgi:hypothetical protein
MQHAHALLIVLFRCWLRVFPPAQIKNGCQFVSETDTEVIPKLLKFAYDNWEGERLPFPKVSQLGSQSAAGRAGRRAAGRSRT